MIKTLPAALDRARTTVTPALRDAVARLAPVVRGPAEYHLGFVDAQGRPVAGGGKHVRAALALLAAAACGADETVGIPGAFDAIADPHHENTMRDCIESTDVSISTARTQRRKSTFGGWRSFCNGRMPPLGCFLGTDVGGEASVAPCLTRRPLRLNIRFFGGYALDRSRNLERYLAIVERLSSLFGWRLWFVLQE